MIAAVMTQWRNFKWLFEALQKEEIKLKICVLSSINVLIYNLTEDAFWPQLLEYLFQIDVYDFLNSAFSPIVILIERVS